MACKYLKQEIKIGIMNKKGNKNGFFKNTLQKQKISMATWQK